MPYMFLAVALVALAVWQIGAAVAAGVCSSKVAVPAERLPSCERKPDSSLWWE